MSEQKSVNEGQTKTETKPKSKTMNILGKVGKFLMYGGWMLVMVLILAILIATSTCGK